MQEKIYTVKCKCGEIKITFGLGKDVDIKSIKCKICNNIYTLIKEEVING